MAKGGTLANIGQALAGYGSALSGNPMYLQNSLLLRQAQQQQAEQEAAKQREQMQGQAVRSMLMNTPLEGTGTPQAKAFQVNGRTVGQNIAAGPQLTGTNARGLMMQQALGPAFDNVFLGQKAQQLISQIFPQSVSGKERYLGTPNGVFDVVTGGIVENTGKPAETKKMPPEVELAMFITGGDENAARELLKKKQDAVGVDAGLNPIYGKDAQGKVVVLQPTKAGQLVQSVVPDGVTPLAPRDVAFERAAGTAGGTAEGQRIATAPNLVATAQNALQNIRDLKNHQALPSALGVIEGKLPAIAGEQADVVSRIEQIKGRAFLQAFETLKGGGAISEREGAAAESAVARLNRAQSPKDFKAALTELETVIETAMNRAQRGLPVQGQPTANVQDLEGQIPAPSVPNDPLGIRKR